MSSRTQAFVLLLFGAALVRLATTDVLLHYVRPVARPWVLLAGLAMVALAVWSLVSDRRGESADDGHGHGPTTRAAWLVIAPVVAILIVAPPALGAYSAARHPVTPTVPRTGLPPLAKGDPVRLTMADFVVRSLSERGTTLTERHVQLTGFVLAGGQGSFVLARLVITCCAADARPVELAVQTTGAIPAKGTWLTVTGTFAGVSSTNTELPVLSATAVAPVAQPANPYD